ncbi:MAG: acyl-CoA dehydrogenase family protein [Panacagrimonas sp.]
MSDDLKDLLRDEAGRMLADLCTPEAVNAAGHGGIARALWDAVEASGLHRSCVGEEAGGAGLTLGDALPMLRRFANFAAPVPMADALLSAGLLDRAGIEAPEGLIALAHGPLTIDAAASGTTKVPYGRHAGFVVAWQPQGDALRVALLETTGARFEPGENLAGEPIDTLDASSATFRAIGSADLSADDLLAWGALLRSALLVGLAERALELAVEHANTRVQFGRTLSVFQALQHSLVVAFGECAAAAAAMESAGALSPQRPHALAVPAAKIRAGKAATLIARTTHQVLGAMGYTHEHALHQYTRRIWSWRDEFGTEAEWARKLGAEARLQARSGQTAALWDWITARGDA